MPKMLTSSLSAPGKTENIQNSILGDVQLVPERQMTKNSPTDNLSGNKAAKGQRSSKVMNDFEILILNYYIK